MPMDKHVFHIVEPCLSSFRLLYEFEHKRLLDRNIKLYSIHKNNWICDTLNANIGDIICIKNHITNIYRRVI